jgi:small GTP-binding protein
MSECGKCHEKYEENTENEPKIMECGDTICSKCIKELKGDNDKFSCPYCKVEINENIEDIPTNKYLLQVMQTILCDKCMKEFGDYSNPKRFPRVLKCGHTYCSNCLAENKKENNDEIQCLDLYCRQKTNGKVEDLRINKIIIQKLENQLNDCLKYVNYQFKSNEIDNCYTIGVIGDSNAGKTSILYFYNTGKILEETVSTAGFDYSIKYIKYKNKNIRLSVFDTAGQEKYRSVTIGAMRGFYGVLLVFSLTRLDDTIDKETYKNKTFENLKFWLEEFHDINKRENSIVYLLGNKLDDKENRVIDYKDAKNFADNNNLKYFETSAIKGKGIKEVFSKLIEDLLDTFPINKPNESDNFSITTRKTNKKKKRC